MGLYSLVKHAMPDQFKKWIDRYNFESEEIQDLTQNPPRTIYVQSFDLSAAVTAGSPQIIRVPGRGFDIYGYTTGDATKTRQTNAFVNIRINQNKSENEFPAKHNRGYRGDFLELYLNWPAQAATTIDLVIFQFDDDPWEVDSTEGLIALAAVGAAPNANGALFVGSTLTLEPADGTNPGVLTAIAQTIGGVKTFLSTIVGNISGSAGSFTGNLAGDVTGPQGTTAIAASVVTGKLITGFASGAGSVAATDTVLQAIDKLDGNIALKAPIASPTFTGIATSPALATPQVLDGASGTINALTSSNRSFIILNTVAASTLNGIVAGTSGQRLVIANRTGNILTINDSSGSAAAGDKILTPGGLGSTIASQGVLEFIYSSSLGNWFVVHN